MSSISRSRFPAGYLGFRPDLGELVRNRRRYLELKQDVLAEEVGISRENLSRIENGHSWPLPDTLDLLMGALELTWDMVAIKGISDRPVRVVDEKEGADQRLTLGRELREERQDKRLSLKEVSERCGLSVAQLSRIERGQASRSSAFMDHPDDVALPIETRRILFRNPELYRLWRAAD